MGVLRCVFGLLVFFFAVLEVHGRTSLDNNKVLVIVDDFLVEETHSRLFDMLENHGYILDIVLASDTDVDLFELGEYSYGSVMFLATNAKKLPGKVTARSLTDFVDAGGNIFVTSSPTPGLAVKKFLVSFGIEQEVRGSHAIDHFNHHKTMDKGDHTVLYSNSVKVANELLHQDFTLPILYKGTALKFASNSSLLLPVVTGDETTYVAMSGHPVEAYPLAGKKSVLVAAMQARNNARVVVTGSLDMFENSFMSAEGTSNEKFADALLRWNFQELGVIRVRDRRHFRVSDGQHMERYRIEDVLRYEFILEEWNGESWIPRKADDILVEFKMLVPYVRLPMKSEGNGLHVLEFKAPDIYGVFQFEIEYHRVGLSFVDIHDQVGMRPFNTNEFERFIPCAYPYYIGAFSVMIAFFIFSVILFHHEDK